MDRACWWMSFAIACVTAPLAAQGAAKDEALIAAVRANDTARAVQLLDQGASPNAADSRGAMPLHVAVSQGGMALVELLLRHGADVNLTDRTGSTPLFVACAGRKAGPVKALLAGGAKPQPADLARACWLGRTDAVGLLLAAGADPSDGLPSASQGGHVEIMRRLIDGGADLDATDRLRNGLGNGPLHLAALQGGDEAVRLLIAAGAKLELLNQDKDTPLLVAAKQGECRAVRSLVKAGANPKVSDLRNASPLHHAVRNRCGAPTIQALVDAGAELEKYDNEGFTPLRRAAIDRHCHSAYAIMLKANGGVERTRPRPRNPGRDQPGKTTETLLKELIEAHRLLAPLQAGQPLTAEVERAATRFQAAEAALIERGEKIMPALIKAWPLAPHWDVFQGLLTRLGPDAEALIPHLVRELPEPGAGDFAHLMIEAIKPGAYARLPLDTRQQAAEATYKGIVASCRGAVISEFSGPSAMFMEFHGELAVPYFLKLLKSDSEAERLVALRRVGGQMKIEPIEQEVIRLITDRRSMRVRRRAIDAVRQAASGNDQQLSPAARAALLGVLKETAAPAGLRHVGPDPRKDVEYLYLWGEAQEAAAETLASQGRR